ncbi:MAG: pantoate--beta-alanine ligase [Candidatus Competibacteraceae bacterium]|nr:pantoate--beta-alanine ligase [Candidatus Competibacteraceae bacterium]MBK8899535.1 pantoate--beta-alanine ligase [Candidatus Competibacteraceae bacterium]MBK8964537.1 pantoate--beta-alanine ligase [Candidatus Competibacteraceae bacterium]
MRTVHTIAELRDHVTTWRRAGERVAFVPTMGNLHRGHIHLVERARQQAPRTVASIFVNPTQFGPNEDFTGYPRTLLEDSRQLEAVGLDLLFAPAVAEIYPRPLEDMTSITVPELSDILCGASRPTHFRGVATVVGKLFNMVQPDIALFGEKDWQQLRVIRRLVDDLNFPIEIVGVPTVREADGLAMSSRNGYLAPEERAIAPTLYATLTASAERLRAGERDYQRLSDEAKARLAAAGFRPDYFEIRRASDLQPPASGDENLRILAAAWLGRARLIDNLAV